MRFVDCPIAGTALGNEASVVSVDPHSPVGFRLGLRFILLHVAIQLSFPYCSWGSQGKNTEVVCQPFSGNHILSALSTMICLSLVAPRAWLSFIELDKAVVLV